jgi:formylglycine-generating enzyme required for sulfatase activity
MTTKLSPSAVMFEKVLRAFETHGITYSDVLARLRRLLATGGEPKELLAVLRRRDSTERLPEYARMDALLVDAVERAARKSEADSPNVEPASAASATDPTGSVATPESRTAQGEVLDLEFDASAQDFDFQKGLRASELDLTALARHLRAVEERPPRGVQLEALTRSYERAKQGESDAAERAAALADDLRAVQSSLEAEQGKAREIEQALLESVASRDAAREEAQREAERYQAELNTLRESLAEREAALDRSRQDIAEREAALNRSRQAISEREDALSHSQRAIAERDARVASLAEERTALASALEDRDKIAAKLEIALRAAQAPVAPEKMPTAARVEAPREALPEQTVSRPVPVMANPAPPPARPVPLSPNAVPPAPNAVPPAPKAVPLPAKSAAMPAKSAAPTAKSTAPSAGSQSRGSGRATGRVVGAIAAALLLLAGLAWMFLHRETSVPAQNPAPAVAALPDPGSSIRDCSSCPEMTVLPSGRFKQGSASGPGYEMPLHWVVIGHPIAMSKYPVTVDDYRRFVSATGRDMQGCDTYDGDWKHRPADSWEQPGFAQAGSHPVTCVSWDDATAYAQWLSSQTGHHYRLPSASEWEYAARAGTEASRPWESDDGAACADGNVADASAGRRYPGWNVFPCDDGYAYTSPVGTFKANAFGLGDMLGNVLQWTADCWSADYSGAPVDGSARVDGDCTLHEVRGGSWFSSPPRVRADYRDRFPADYRASSIGIRLVRDLGS